MKTSEQLNELAAALSLAQADLATAKKDSSGYGYNYSDLASVLATAKPVLEKNGLSVSQLVGSSKKFENSFSTVTVTTILLHKSGQYISEEASIEVPEMNKINATQKAGAAISYLRRYSLQAILGMASEDNDASTEVKASTQASVSVKIQGNSNSVSNTNIDAPPKLTEAQAKATTKAPSFSRNKLKADAPAKTSNDLGI